MNDTHLSLVPDQELNDDPPSAADVIDVLSQALRGRSLPPCRTLVKGQMASSDEGLSLIQSFIDIRDSRVRQAVLRVVAALAGDKRS